MFRVLAEADNKVAASLAGREGPKDLWQLSRFQISCGRAAVDQEHCSVISACTICNSHWALQMPSLSEFQQHVLLSSLVQNKDSCTLHLILKTSGKIFSRPVLHNVAILCNYGCNTHVWRDAFRPDYNIRPIALLRIDISARYPILQHITLYLRPPKKASTKSLALLLLKYRAV